MFVTPQRVAATAGALLLLLCAAVAVVAQPAPDNDGARLNALETAAVSAGRPAALPQPTTPAPAVSSVRAIEADDAVSGSEPDPETFDRHGLEIWWQGHMQKKP